MSTSVVPSSGRRTLVSVLVGVLAAVVGAVVFATVIGVTKYEIGFGAVGIGALVGFAMSQTATPTRALAPVAAVVSLAGCLLGEVMGFTALIAKDEAFPVLEAEKNVLLQPDLFVEILKASFSPMSLLFWALAVYAGYSFVAKRVAALEAQVAAERAAAQQPAVEAVQQPEPGPAA